MNRIYEQTWRGLRNYVPRWLDEGKFGIYTHWGVYSVPAWPDGTWYPHYARETEPHKACIEENV